MARVRRSRPVRSLGRRELLGGAVALCSTALGNALGCGSAALGAGGGGGDGGEAGAGGTGTSSASSSSGGWATGGTAAIGDGYPDPFAAGPGTSCELSCAATLGPCYAATVERKDLSEGNPGLPLRLALLIVDADCNPVEGAEVDVWHTSYRGLYSGSDAADMCTDGDPQALAARWFRGVQRTDAEGRVDFDTCYPGWYASRAVHIHFQIRVGGVEYLTSQLFFPTSVNTDVFSTHEVYAPFGQPDTSNETDGIYDAAFLLDVERMDDGVMLASKRIVLRASTAEALCGASGGGPGGPGGRAR